MGAWMNKDCPSFPLIPFKLMAFLSPFQGQKYILAKPDCQEDKFSSPGE